MSGRQPGRDFELSLSRRAYRVLCAALAVCAGSAVAAGAHAASGGAQHEAAPRSGEAIRLAQAWRAEGRGEQRRENRQEGRERRPERREQRQERRENRQGVREQRQENRQGRRELRQENREGRRDEGRQRRQLSGERRDDRQFNRQQRTESRGEHLRNLRERAQERRENRFEARQERRENREDRREIRQERREDRFDRRQDRLESRVERRENRIERRQERRDDRRRFRRSDGDWRGRRVGNPRVIRESDGVRIRTRRFRDYRGREWEARSRRYRAVNRRYYNRFRDGRSIYWLPPVAGLALGAYLVSAARADYDDYYTTFRAGPVVPLDRRYTLDEIIADPAIRSKVRSVDLDNITFASGSAEVSDYQAGKLEDLADAMLEILDEDPGQVFLVAGHTDATGDYDLNLDLSEDRAAAVVELLVSEYGVPAANLEAVGYGEAYLLVDTDGPSRENRRVVIRAVGDLLARR